MPYEIPSHTVGGLAALTTVDRDGRIYVRINERLPSRKTKAPLPDRRWRAKLMQIAKHPGVRLAYVVLIHGLALWGLMDFLARVSGREWPL